ncbi:hypothetical protein HYFRA_00000154 [Hymenoscyphus fraxineus]|uniref:Uncharacterized protein n=1 Tax=Hymenoscyphus fraxineus TaxID=746836 RepID=A0A9N9PL25_9HELO|nr:hypothetical protein HYFRA_00000154 [Hymenoscyphus fraxineus]
MRLTRLLALIAILVLSSLVLSAPTTLQDIRDALSKDPNHYHDQPSPSEKVPRGVVLPRETRLKTVKIAVIGGVAGLVVLSILALCCCHRKKS